MQSRDNSYKKRGILAAVSSLPSDYGIGCFDEEAYKFVDFLAESNQDYWQILPLCPVGKGNSPYSSYSAFGGEILYLDLGLLQKEGLIDDIPHFKETERTDYSKAKKFKLPLIKSAAESFDTSNKDYINFCKENGFWLDNFAEFMVIKELLDNLPLHEWEDGYKYRLPEIIKRLNEENQQKINFYKITQYWFYSQYKKLKSYANSKGIKIIGDIPFYISADSADVWGNPDCFKLKRDMSPSLVAGVPPDIFSSDGQLWGNPIYDWEYQRENDYKWWQERLSFSAELYDVIRMDHFRAFADYYVIDADAENARNGYWTDGEGMNFWNEISPLLKECEIIAEDLGGETPKVQMLIEDTGFPNMKLLQFAFDSDLSDPFLPHNFNENCICYTGTHDNNTTLGWYKTATKKEKIFFDNLIPQHDNMSPVYRMIDTAMKSVAKTVIIPFQDYLELDEKARMNIPGKESGNWEWRFKKEDLTDELAEKIRLFSRN